MSGWFALLLSFGAFGAPTDATEALERLAKTEQPGERLLLLEELPDLIERDRDPAARRDELAAVTTADWSDTVLAGWHETRHVLDGRRLPGRPVSIDLVRTFPCGIEAALLMTEAGLDSLARPLNRRIRWTGTQPLLAHAVEDTLPADTHEFRSVLVVESTDRVVIEVDAMSAWGLRLGQARWSQSRLGPSLPDRVRLAVRLPAGAHPFTLRVEGGDTVRWRLVSGAAHWADPGMKDGPSAGAVLEPVPIDVLEKIRDWPEGRARWLVARGMGDLLAARDDPWEECRRLLADPTVGPETLQRSLQPLLDRVLAAQPGHVGALVESARLAQAQQHPVEAHRLLTRARRLAPDEPGVLAASIRLAVMENQLVAARHWCRRLQQRAPEWSETERLHLAVDQIAAPADRIAREVRDLAALRQLAHGPVDRESRAAALAKMAELVPWELRVHVDRAALGLQVGRRPVSADWPRGPGAGAAWSRMITTTDDTDPFTRWRPGPELYKPVARFPDSSSSLLFDMMGLEFHEDGSLTEIIHQLIRIHGDRGIDEWTTFHPWGDFLELRVITPDGDSWIPLVVPGEEEVTLPRLEPGALIEMRTRRHWDSRQAAAYGGSKFYFRDPQRRSTLAHSLYVIRHPRSMEPRVLARGLEDLGRGDERYTYNEEETGNGRVRVWETRNMKAIPPTPHHLPDEVELPWVRVHPPQPEALTAARWIETTEPYLAVPGHLRALVTSITAGRLGDDEKLEALVEWHGRNIQPGGEPVGHRALQARRGRGDTSLTTLLRAAGFEAHLFHARPDHRFHDPSDKIDRAEGYWPVRGVAVVRPAGLVVLAADRPWLGFNEVPESWAGRRARYWKDGGWKTFTLPALPVLSIEARTVTLDLVDDRFTFRQEREGDSLIGWRDWLHASTLDSQGDLGDLGLFAGLRPKSTAWTRPEAGRLALVAGGTCKGVMDQGWTLPPLLAVRSWMPDGPVGTGLWIGEDRVTVDEVHVVVPEGMKLVGVPEPVRLVEPGVALEWEVEEGDKGILVRRTWRVQAGFIRGAVRRRFYDLLKQADLLDRRRWRLEKR